MLLMLVVLGAQKEEEQRMEETKCTVLSTRTKLQGSSELLG